MRRLRQLARDHQHVRVLEMHLGVIGRGLRCEVELGDRRRRVARLEGERAQADVCRIKREVLDERAAVRLARLARASLALVDEAELVLVDCLRLVEDDELLVLDLLLVQNRELELRNGAIAVADQPEHFAAHRVQVRLHLGPFERFLVVAEGGREPAVRVGGPAQQHRAGTTHLFLDKIPDVRRVVARPQLGGEVGENEPPVEIAMEKRIENVGELRERIDHAQVAALALVPGAHHAQLEQAIVVEQGRDHAAIHGLGRAGIDAARPVIGAGGQLGVILQVRLGVEEIRLRVVGVLVGGERGACGELVLRAGDRRRESDRGQQNGEYRATHGRMAHSARVRSPTGIVASPPQVPPAIANM